MELVERRKALRLSQAKLAGLAQVSRFKLCNYEMGSCELTEEELRRIADAMRKDAEALRKAIDHIR